MKKLLLLLTLALVTQLTFAQNVPSYVPTDGLVGYWPFNGDANDESGNGLNGTVNGATLTADRFGAIDKSYLFSNDNIEVNIPNSFFSKDFSISAWVLLDNFNNTYPTFISEQNNSLCLQFANSVEPPVVNFYFQSIDAIIGQVEDGHVNGGNIILNNWVNITVINSNKTNNLYVNGIYIGSSISQSTIQGLGLGNYLRFGNGSDKDLPMAEFNGKLDDIVIYNRALTQEEITNMYNGVEYSDTCNAVSGSLVNGLVGYWPFCGNANDQSGNGNNGVVNGATLTTDRFENSNSAYSFDGNDWIELNLLPAINNSNQLAVSIWVKSTGINSNTNCNVGCHQFYFSRGYDGGNGFLLFTSQGSTPNFVSGVNGPFNGGEGVENPNYNSIPDTQWNHLLMNYDGISIKFYVNGILVGTTPYTKEVGVGNTSNAVFGRQFVPNFPYYTIGKIDDAAIWNRALTQQEITQLYNQNQCMTNITVTDTLVINVGQLSYTNPIYYANNITLYPNPANTQVNISFTNITDLTGGQIKIINSLGQQVATTPITLSGTNTTMPLTTWGGAGLYFVQIINPQGQIVDIKKIILQ